MVETFIHCTNNKKRRTVVLCFTLLLESLVAQSKIGNKKQRWARIEGCSHSGQREEGPALPLPGIWKLPLLHVTFRNFLCYQFFWEIAFVTSYLYIKMGRESSPGPSMRNKLNRTCLCYQIVWLPIGNR